jgi:hypothetical protein
MKLFFGSGKNRPVSTATDVRDYLIDDLKYQYQDGRSMAEAAKCWVAADGCLPSTIAAVIGGNQLNSAHFEYPTTVWGGGTAMTDVMAFLPNGVVAVEAKLNEPFDAVVADWIKKEAEKNDKSPPHRRKVIKRYANAFRVEAERLLSIRYQLLQRTLCAALTARSAGQTKAWMIIQSFAQPETDGYRKNQSDFTRFVELIGNAPVLEGVRVDIAWTDNAISLVSNRRLPHTHVTQTH